MALCLPPSCNAVTTSIKHNSDSGFLIIQVAKSALIDCGFVPETDIHKKHGHD